MSTLISNINLNDFIKIVQRGQTEELKSVEVYEGDSYLFTAIIGHGDVYSKDYARIQSEGLAVRTNMAGGKEPEDLLVEVPETSLYNRRVEQMAKAREAKRLKGEAKNESRLPVPV